METFDSFSLIIGVIGVGIGLYELVTRNIVGRDLSGISETQIRKFLPYDVLTYIIAGALLALMGAGRWFAFVKTTAFIMISIFGSLAVIALNFVVANKILGKPSQRPPHL